MHQRAMLNISCLMADRDHPADHHAEQDVNERSPDILPDGAQLPRMLAQPSCSGSLELGRFLRKGAERPGGKMGAGCLDHLGHFLERFSDPLDSREIRPRMPAPIAMMTTVARRATAMILPVRRCTRVLVWLGASTCTSS